VTDRESRRLSFGSVAADYDRYRPAPPPQALDWLIPPHATAVLDLAAGTGAVTRVLIESGDGSGSGETWSTVGVDENIIAASWHALEEAVTYSLLRSGEPSL